LVSGHNQVKEGIQHFVVFVCSMYNFDKFLSSHRSLKPVQTLASHWNKERLDVLTQARCAGFDSRRLSAF